MKTTIMAVIGLGLCIQAHGETLSTTDGATYDNITMKRAEPDGLYIEYTPASGGLGMSKIKFSRLSADQQKQYGYDAKKAAEFEANIAKATEAWRQECARSEQASKAERQAQEARDQQQEQVATDRILALAQLKQAEAELARASGGSGSDGMTAVGGGYGLWAIPEISGAQLGRNERAPEFRPTPAAATAVGLKPGPRVTEVLANSTVRPNR